MRTSIDIDDRLMREAMKSSGARPRFVAPNLSSRVAVVIVDTTVWIDYMRAR